MTGGFGDSLYLDRRLRELDSSYQVIRLDQFGRRAHLIRRCPEIKVFPNTWLSPSSKPVALGAALLGVAGALTSVDVHPIQEEKKKKWMRHFGRG